jgi:hypothetical protein
MLTLKLGEALIPTVSRINVGNNEPGRAAGECRVRVRPPAPPAGELPSIPGGIMVTVSRAGMLPGSTARPGRGVAAWVRRRAGAITRDVTGGVAGRRPARKDGEPEPSVGENRIENGIERAHAQLLAADTSTSNWL